MGSYIPSPVLIQRGSRASQLPRFVEVMDTAFGLGLPILFALTQAEVFYGDSG